MRTHVELRSNQFPSYGNESEGVNFEAGIYGKRLAEFLQEKLPQKGIPVSGIFDEDWGWCVTIANGSHVTFIGCSNDEEQPNGFRCFINPSKPFVRKWFSKIDIRSDIEQVAAALDSVLRENAEITGVRWWSDTESGRS